MTGGWSRLWLAAICGGFLSLAARADDPTYPTNQLPGDIQFLLGTPQAFPHLGFGWTDYTEYHKGRTYSWVRHLEADLHFDLSEPGDAEIWLRVAPLYLAYRRQTVALYVNDRFVAEWVCADDSDYQDFHARIKKDTFRTGPNRLTLRMAHRKKGGDRRELSLAVDQILIRFDDDAPSGSS